MFYLVTFAISAILALAFVARINKSNKLFWTLLVSGLLGFAGGSVYRGLAHHGKDTGDKYVISMQAPGANFNAANMMDNTFIIGTDILASNGILVRSTKPAGKKRVHVNSPVTRTLQAFNPDYDIGECFIPNTS